MSAPDTRLWTTTFRVFIDPLFLGFVTTGPDEGVRDDHNDPVPVPTADDTGSEGPVSETEVTGFPSQGHW